MAGAKAITPESTAVPVGSYDTALCIIPPKHIWPSFDRLRMLYDKAYEKWPPHLNLIYPFVQIESLPRAAELILSNIRSQRAEATDTSLQLRLDAAGVFPHRRDNTIFKYDSDKGHVAKVAELRKSILKALGSTNTSHRLHMTLAQTEDINDALHKFMLHKASAVPALEWDVGELCILVRERTQIDGSSSSQMKLWGKINLQEISLSQCPTPRSFYDVEQPNSSSANEEEAVAESGSLSRSPYTYSTEAEQWEIVRRQQSLDDRKPCPASLSISSYNVLAEFQYPPSQVRYPILLANLLDQSASADVVVLEEVTDDFISYLLRDSAIRKQYPFVSNGPSDQPDIDPLPSHLNVVVLSKWSFTWDWVSFNRRHKGSVVLQFDDIGKEVDDVFAPAILATVHLTCGLTDGSVAAKKVELQSILNYLSKSHPKSPWILAGDFNITTSAYTIEAALKKKTISTQTAKYLVHLEKMLSEAGFTDSWTAARLQNLDSTQLGHDEQYFDAPFEGEQGATFDPTVNDLAAKIVGSGFNNRPQRYDRILVKGADLLTVSGFNLFGLHTGTSGDKSEADVSNDAEVQISPEHTFGSDHWGVRCALKLAAVATDVQPDETARLIVPVEPRSAPESLSDVSELKSFLASSDILPSEDEIARREAAFQLLRDTIIEDKLEETPSLSRSKVSFIVVPVGSYGLGVWTASSDIDCLCIGPISSKVFFTLATQRLRKAASKGVKILRRVNAHSGTMLELEVGGIKMDLQYCPSTPIAENLARALSLPTTHPVFTLPTQSLAKLKSLRDLHYIKRTQTDFSAFRTSYRLIKTWAKSRGVYAARFGYLSGIHISLLLLRVCKLLARDGTSTTVPDILSAFFHHYANFDWKNDMVFDPFFHKRLRYVRTAREPMVILSYHAPSLNIAHAASLPSVRTITEELQRADTLLSTEGMTWERFLGASERSETSKLSEGAANFVTAYKSYIKIDAQFWGVSSAKGSQFVGWLESRCVMLLVDLNRRLPNIHARIWPSRFVDEESSDEDKDYQGYYLVGLDQLEGPDGQAMTKDELKVALGSLHTVLQKFEGQIRGDEKYFDQKTTWMSAMVVKQADLGNVKLDSREWGEYTIGDDEMDEEEDDEEEDLGSDDFDSSEAENSTSRKSKRKTADKAVPLRPAYTGKFRSSADVINRLRWDPDLNSGDYIVGYEDRFLGTMERALDQWKAEQTDEEFIPQHRILYFKRQSDGVVVWDRNARRDEIFGSGVQKSDAQ